MAERKSVESLLAEGGGNISDHLRLLADLGQDFAASLDIEETLRSAIERITTYLDAAGGALFMLEEGGSKLRCHACHGATEITGLTLNSEQGIVGRCVQTDSGTIVRDTAGDPDFDISADEQTGFTTRSILCAPLSVHGEKIGAIELVNKLSEDGQFTEADLAILQAMSSAAALAIINARMAAELMEQERVRRELELAAEIQRGLLPEDRGDGFPVHGINRPARTVSGDFYDFFQLDDGRICFNLGDVSGKGMNAALLMAKTASLYRCLGKTIHQSGLLLAKSTRKFARPRRAACSSPWWAASTTRRRASSASPTPDTSRRCIAPRTVPSGRSRPRRHRSASCRPCPRTTHFPKPNCALTGAPSTFSLTG